MRRRIKRYKRKIELAADNTNVYKSKQIEKVLSLLEIIRLIWPSQSPDLNPIKYC